MEDVNFSTQEIDVASFINGVYLLIATDAEWQKYSQKFIKN